MPTSPASRLRRAARRLLAATLTGVLGTAVAVAGPGRPASAEGYTGPQPGTFTGLGFDTCSAPSDAAMTAWLQSPYRAVGVYIGGVNRGCAQPELTAGWVASQQAKGWRIFPLYVGLQAPCTTYLRRIDPARAADQGREAADDAVANARALGLAPWSTLILDMEHYEPGDAGCTAAVDAFVHAWTVRLHFSRYLSGYYTGVASGSTSDLVAAYGRSGFAAPDVIDFARWDGVTTVADPVLPAAYWQPKRRMKQYEGDHDETWGGVMINVDSNYLDLVQPAHPRRYVGPGATAPRG